MARHLKANQTNQISLFLHPVTKKYNCIFLNPAQTLKLAIVRNIFGNRGTIYY